MNNGVFACLCVALARFQAINRQRAAFPSVARTVQNSGRPVLACVSILRSPTFDPALPPAAAGDQPAALQVPPSSINVESALAQPLRQKSRKSMSRRSGQSSKPYKAGKWWRVRVRFDVPGVEKRQQKSLKVCPVALRLPKPEIERLTKEVIAASGANSVERFNRVVLGEGVTFREQAKLWLQGAVSRNRRPIKNPTSIEGALRKWINPAIGDLLLSQVDNLSVQPLVKKLVSEGKSPRTIEKYVQYVKQVVKSLRSGNGEPLYPRTWNSEVLDLPIIEYRKQRRPSLKIDGVTELIAKAKSKEEQALYVLEGATGMRISEALALEARHFIHGGKSILIEQQVDKDCPRIVPYVKTDFSYREIDLHPDIAAYLRKFVSHKTGLIFRTSNGTPHLYANLEDHGSIRSLTNWVSTGRVAGGTCFGASETRG
jgi:integrase